MMVNFKIHSISHLLKAVLGSMEKLLGGLNYSSEELIVVNYHSTPEKFIREFQEQIKFYKRHFNIIAPKQLNEYYKTGLNSGKCNLLITFDDGLKNNLHAVKVLEKEGLAAVFFIVPGFIEMPADKQKDFYLKNIRPVVNSNVDSKQEDFTAMNWNEIRSLLEKNHSIGCHTYTHSLSIKKTNEKNSEKEILESKKRIEEKLNIQVNSFCSINNTLESTGSFEKKLVNANYSFHFTTFPGLNSENKNPLFIKRRNVEVYWLKGSLYFALGKSDLKRWKKEIEAYNNL